MVPHRGSSGAVVSHIKWPSAIKQRKKNSNTLWNSNPAALHAFVNHRFRIKIGIVATLAFVPFDKRLRRGGVADRRAQGVGCHVSRVVICQRGARRGGGVGAVPWRQRPERPRQRGRRQDRSGRLKPSGLSCRNLHSVQNQKSMWRMWRQEAGGRTPTLPRTKIKCESTRLGTYTKLQQPRLPVCYDAVGCEPLPLALACIKQWP